MIILHVHTLNPVQLWHLIFVSMAELGSVSIVEKWKRGQGNCLNDAQCLEIIEKLWQTSGKKPSMRSLAREYGVDEKAI